MSLMVGKLLQPFDGDQSADEQVQFIRLMDGGLETECDLFWIDADGKVIHDDGACVIGNLEDAFFVRFRGQHVQVGDEEEALIFVLKGEPVLMAANVVPQMQLAGGPIAGEDSFAGSLSVISISCS